MHLLPKEIQEDDGPDGLEMINTTSLFPEASINDQVCNNCVTNKHPGLEDFRKEITDETSSRQRFMVSREDGLEELKKDILQLNSEQSLTLNLKERVELPAAPLENSCSVP